MENNNIEVRKSAYINKDAIESALVAFFNSPDEWELSLKDDRKKKYLSLSKGDILLNMRIVVSSKIEGGELKIKPLALISYSNSFRANFALKEIQLTASQVQLIEKKLKEKSYL